MRASVAQISPDLFWEGLHEGNLKFVAGKLHFDELKEEREKLAGHQDPPITVLSCADSRVPPELVFDRSLGGLFVVRSAGSITDELGLASIEYAVDQGHTHRIVVLGHENCGAVRTAFEGGKPTSPHLIALLKRIRSAFTRETNTLEKAVHANTRASARWLVANSKIVRDAVAAGKLEIIPAYYTMRSGEVKKLN